MSAQPSFRHGARAFDASELELIAETLDAFVKLANVTGRRHLHSTLGDLSARARAQASVLLRGTGDPDLDQAVNDAAEDLANRYGRSAVLFIAPRAVVVCGMTDDLEREWTTVRGIGQLVSTARASTDEVRQAQTILHSLEGQL